MYKAFIEPDLKTAHIKIINKFNPFTGFQNPTYILKVILCDILSYSNFLYIFKCVLDDTLLQLFQLF
jgi:hypothetical protein